MVRSEMHPLVDEICRRSTEVQFLRSLLRHLKRGPVDEKHIVILDNLNRFEGFRVLIGSCIGAYLCSTFRSRRTNRHCWRAFRTLLRMEIADSRAAAAAVVARGHGYRRLRLASRSYLEFLSVTEQNDCRQSRDRVAVGNRTPSTRRA